MVQMCVSNAQGVEEFVDELKSVASAEKLEFVDNSSYAQRELQELGDPNGRRPDGTHMIDVRLIRNDGLAIGATNIGLPGYQLAMGFSAGSNAAEARNFATRTLARFRQRWPIETVLDGTGALPVAGCR
jgi:hypothetical protein